MSRYLSLRVHGEAHLQSVVQDWLNIFHEGWVFSRVLDVSTLPKGSTLDRLRKPLASPAPAPHVRVEILQPDVLGVAHEVKDIMIPTQAFFTEEGFWQAVDGVFAQEKTTKVDNTHRLQAIVEKYAKAV